MEATFTEGRANFNRATFSKGGNFSGTKFLAEAYFIRSEFTGIKITFEYAIFEKPDKVRFDNSNLSRVSFADSDITRIRFGDNVEWGKKDNKFTIIDEEELSEKVKRQGFLRKKVKEQTGPEYEDTSLELVLSVYRNLRENYEFRLRYDDAGKFFIKEMDLKRKYREISKKELRLITLFRLKGDIRPLPEVGDIIENSWFTRNFSLTGLYYHLSRYGESISRPTLIALITVFLSTLFWVTQGNPTLEPHFDPTLETVSTSTFVGFEKAGNATQWLEGFERSLAGFLPFLSAGGETQVGIIDYIIKIFGGGLTFVLLAIALRRKFERKYTR